MPIIVSCKNCGTSISLKPSHVTGENCCSRSCMGEWRKIKYKGENNPNFGNKKEKSSTWKGGRRISNYGYILLFMPDHPMARPDGYILEHRFIMSEYLGRVLEKGEHVHHKDGNRKNNDIDNLVILTAGEHAKLHGAEWRRHRIQVVCAYCGKAEKVKPSRALNYKCCSTTCSRAYKKSARHGGFGSTGS